MYLVYFFVNHMIGSQADFRVFVDASILKMDDFDTFIVSYLMDCPF